MGGFLTWSPDIGPPPETTVEIHSRVLFQKQVKTCRCDIIKKLNDCCLGDFECNVGSAIADYDEFSGRLQVDFNVSKTNIESIYDEHGEVESFFNNFTYETKYDHIYLISSENFDTKDNDYIQYKLMYSRKPLE